MKISDKIAHEMLILIA